MFDSESGSAAASVGKGRLGKEEVGEILLVVEDEDAKEDCDEGEVGEEGEVGDSKEGEGEDDELVASRVAFRSVWRG
jgi:hypothetical protein